MARPHCNYIALWSWVGCGRGKQRVAHCILCCIVTRAAALRSWLTINSVSSEWIERWEPWVTSFMEPDTINIAKRSFAICAACNTLYCWTIDLDEKKSWKAKWFYKTQEKEGSQLEDRPTWNRLSQKKKANFVKLQYGQGANPIVPYKPYK